MDIHIHTSEAEDGSYANYRLLENGRIVVDAVFNPKDSNGYYMCFSELYILEQLLQRVYEAGLNGEVLDLREITE